MWLKVVHVIGAVLLLGNILVTAWWKVMADLSGDWKVMVFAQRQVLWTDLVFTVSGATLLLLSGFGIAAAKGFNPFTTRWTAWGIGMLALSGIIWIAVLIPIQLRQARLARDYAGANYVPNGYRRLSYLWMVFGGIATILPLLSLYWMVVKP